MSNLKAKFYGWCAGAVWIATFMGMCIEDRNWFGVGLDAIMLLGIYLPMLVSLANQLPTPEPKVIHE